MDPHSICGLSGLLLPLSIVFPSPPPPAVAGVRAPALSMAKSYPLVGMDGPLLCRPPLMGVWSLPPFGDGERGAVNIREPGCMVLMEASGTAALAAAHRCAICRRLRGLPSCQDRGGACGACMAWPCPEPAGALRLFVPAAPEVQPTLTRAALI